MQSDKKTISLSIKKSIGTLNKVMTMIDEDIYCADIAQQINAAMWLLRVAKLQLLKDHLACCWKTKLTSNNKDDVATFIDEFARVRDMSGRK
jgi:CsoR family transcriptional regulator, copper-sensing transcriptional repressor